MSEDKSTWYWETQLTTIQKQWQEIEKTHLLLLTEDSTLKQSYFQENKFDKLQIEVELVIQQLLARINNEKTNNCNNHKVNLPKIIIPVFTGSYESWDDDMIIIFYDLFLKIIHEDTALSATEKLQYLKTHSR